MMVSLYMVFFNIITMSFNYQCIDSAKYLQGQGHLNLKRLCP